MSKRTKLLIIVGILASFWIGFAVRPVNIEPEVVIKEIEVPKIEYITVTQEVPVPYEVIKERIIIVPEKVPVEVTVYRNIYPRDFTSVKEFKEWWEKQGFAILFPSGAYEVDCDDYSARLQRKALEQGYSISQALALYGVYFGVTVTDEKAGHAGNLILIGNTYYWVEPNPEAFNIIKIVDRD